MAIAEEVVAKIFERGASTASSDLIAGQAKELFEAGSWTTASIDATVQQLREREVHSVGQDQEG